MAQLYAAFISKNTNWLKVNNWKNIPTQTVTKREISDYTDIRQNTL